MCNIFNVFLFYCLCIKNIFGSLTYKQTQINKCSPRIYYFHSHPYTSLNCLNNYNCFKLWEKLNFQFLSTYLDFEHAPSIS